MEGKLELLFAHLSMNNVAHIRPLLLDAIDEYQNMCTGLNYDERRKINFIKTLLWHAERSEWQLARECLRGAEAVYQEYLRKKMAEPQAPKMGYTQIHGLPRLAFSDDNAEREQNNGARIRTPVDLGSARSVVTRDYRSRSSDSSTLSSARTSSEEQGPKLVTPRSSNGFMANNYPGTYGLYPSNATQRRTVDVDGRIRRSGPTTQDNSMQQGVIAVAHPNDEDVTAAKKSLTNLFEKEWYHALMTLKRLAVMEDNSLKFLADVLLESYKICEEEAQSQVLEFENAALKIITDGKYTQEERGALQTIGDSRLMMQYRRNVAELSLKRLQDTFLTKVMPVLFRKYELKSDDVVDHYARACIDVTWHMVVQEPPFYLVDDRDKGPQGFDLNLYRPYSKVGRAIQYIVWPPMMLRKEGRLLTCGYAQGDGCT